MSTKRQPEFCIRTFAISTRIASMLPPQSAEWAQLIYATQGSLIVESPIGEQLWYVPARRALWIPAGVASTLRMRGTVRLRMLYVHRSFCKALQVTHAINVAPLLHETILEAVRRSVLPPREPLAQLILQLLLASSSVPLMLPMPRDTRALRVSERLLKDPAVRSTLDQLGRHAGAGSRTLERAFLNETGMGFAAWRQRLRMLEGMRYLLEGGSVADAAENVGYASVSAFVVAFKATLGETPGKWLRS
jgi:AraC-like DNA-binding protein